MKNIIITAVIALIVSIGVSVVIGNALKSQVRFGGTTDVSHFSGGVSYGGPTGVNQIDGFSTLVSSGGCNTGTTTLFAIKSPFNATSTITMAEIQGIAAATTTDIIMGTSTTPGMLGSSGTSTLAENLTGLAGIATSSQFYAVAGNKIGPGLGYAGVTSALSGLAGLNYVSNVMLTVGPNEYIMGIATSSYLSALTGGGSTAAQTPAPSSCFYSIEWQR